MRRYVLPFAVAVAAALAACSGGGSVLSTGGSTASNIIITSANQNANSVGAPLSVRVAQASGINQPLVLHAQGVNGQQNGAVYPPFTWSAGYQTSGTISGGATGTPVSCGPLTVVPSAQPAAPATPTPAVATGYTLPASAVTGSAQDSSYATFQPPPRKALVPVLSQPLTPVAFGTMIASCGGERLVKIILPSKCAQRSSTTTTDARPRVSGLPGNVSVRTSFSEMPLYA